MPASEDEEFEFRLRAEQEAGVHAPAGGGAQPPASDGWDQGVVGPAVAGMAEGGANMLTGAVAKPAGDIAGLGAMVKDMLSGAKGDIDPTAVQAKVRDFLTYAPRTKAGEAVSQYNPLALIGKAVDAGGQGLEDSVMSPADGKTDISPARVGAAKGLHEVVNQLPALLGVKYGGKAASPQVSALLKDKSRGLMSSALKPRAAELESGDAAKAIDTMLDKGLNATRGGVNKMQARIDQLQTGIDKAIDANPALRVSKDQIAQPLRDKITQLSKQVNSTDDLAAIQKAFVEFMNPMELDPQTMQLNPKASRSTMSVREAQEMKKGTYRQLERKSAYDSPELKAATVESQVALAKGLKDVVAKAVPAVAPLNAEESALLNSLSITERRVLLDANKNPIGLGWLTTDPVKFAGWMADRSPLFKSLVARMLNQGSQSMAGVGRAAQAAGVGATAGANQAAGGQ